jgi:hypothetical protein
MPTIVKTESGNWKAVIRKTGFPTATKTFRLKRDAEDWARRAEDEMVRGCARRPNSDCWSIFGRRQHEWALAEL